MGPSASLVLRKEKNFVTAVNGTMIPRLYGLQLVTLPPVLSQLLHFCLSGN